MHLIYKYAHATKPSRREPIQSVSVEKTVGKQNGAERIRVRLSHPLIQGKIPTLQFYKLLKVQFFISLSSLIVLRSVCSLSLSILLVVQTSSIVSMNQIESNQMKTHSANRSESNRLHSKRPGDQCMGKWIAIFPTTYEIFPLIYTVYFELCLEKNLFQRNVNTIFTEKTLNWSWGNHSINLTNDQTWRSKIFHRIKPL